MYAVAFGSFYNAAILTIQANIKVNVSTWLTVLPSPEG